MTPFVTIFHVRLQFSHICNSSVAKQCVNESCCWLFKLRHEFLSSNFSRCRQSTPILFVYHNLFYVLYGSKGNYTSGLSFSRSMKENTWNKSLCYNSTYKSESARFMNCHHISNLLVKKNQCLLFKIRRKLDNGSI